MANNWRQVGNVKLIDNSKLVLQASKRGINAALVKVGIAAKHNTQENILAKDIFDTGELYRTIDYQPNFERQNVAIGSPKNYAPFQELGTYKLAPRPFLKPAIMENINEYKQIVEETLKNT